jgi:hypothetical protein
VTNKGSCLSPALGVTEFITVTDIILVRVFFVLLNLHVDLQLTHIWKKEPDTIFSRKLMIFNSMNEIERCNIEELIRNIVHDH